MRARIHRHADRECIRERLPPCERARNVWNGGGRRGRFNIPTVYSSGSVDIGYRKITSILVNIPPLHARNNAGMQPPGRPRAFFSELSREKTEAEIFPPGDEKFIGP